MTRRLFLATAGLLLLSGVARAQNGGAARPAITFTKDFPGSVPPYYSITLRQTDAEKYIALYRVDPEEDPTEMEIAAPLAQRAFELAKELDYFSGPPLESKRKVAQMGRKTLRYDDGSQHGERSFNHTELPAAVELTSWFERLANTQGHVDRILYLLRFDRLGIVKELLQTEMDLNNDRLLQPALLIPALEKVLANKSLVNVAHERADTILSRLNPAR
jgi:hypothetical protein